MQTIPQALKARAAQIMDLSRCKPLADQLHACSVSARMVARAAQLSGDDEGFRSNLHLASKFAHLAEIRAKVHTQH